jgi:hypothetical protein
MRRINWKTIAQIFVVLGCALTLKLYYSSNSVNELRWILAPTTALVQLISGDTFAFESHAGYINSDRSFVIAASCAGVNFLITAFLMVSLRRIWRNWRWSAHLGEDQSGDRSPHSNLSWRFIPAAAVFAYLATIITNTVRISTALWLHGMPVQLGGLSRNQLHRLEGILIYFGFLLILFVVTEKISSENTLEETTIEQHPSSKSGLLRRSLFPLLIYYAATLGIPLAHAAYRGGIAADFWEHSLFVLLTPLVFMFLMALVELSKNRYRTVSGRLVSLTSRRKPLQSRIQSQL